MQTIPKRGHSLKKQIDEKPDQVVIRDVKPGGCFDYQIKNDYEWKTSY